MLSAHRIDIKTTNLEGAFNCPNCDTFISPDDETKKVYSVVETIMRNDTLKEIVILCRCKTLLNVSI